jgi:hypothetical protein
LIGTKLKENKGEYNRAHKYVERERERERERRMCEKGLS